jgi:hypothetical protein
LIAIYSFQMANVAPEALKRQWKNRGLALVIVIKTLI